MWLSLVAITTIERFMLEIPSNFLLSWNIRISLSFFGLPFFVSGPKESSFVCPLFSSLLLNYPPAIRETMRLANDFEVYARTTQLVIG